jgi:hypothetical protein
VSPDGLIIVGSSPATISVYRRGERRPCRSINLTMDVRNSIHGLELEPTGATSSPMAKALPLGASDASGDLPEGLAP